MGNNVGLIVSSELQNVKKGRASLALYPTPKARVL
jgi:hypothetical protein